MDAYLHSRIKDGYQMQSKAGTHHGDAVETSIGATVEDAKVQEIREAMDLLKQLWEKVESIFEVDCYGHPQGTHFGMLHDMLVLKAHKIKGTI